MNNTSACLITGILLSSLIFVGEGRGRASDSKVKQGIGQWTVSVKKGSGQMGHSKGVNSTIFDPLPSSCVQGGKG